MTVVPQIPRVLKQVRIDRTSIQKAIILHWFPCSIKSQSETHFLNQLVDEFRSSYNRASSFLADQHTTDSLDEYSDILNS